VGGGHLGVHHAPIIVSGEDAFSETPHGAHGPRGPARRGPNPDTLERVKGWDAHSFAYAYLTWLHLGLQDGSLPVIRNFEAGPEDLPGRQRLNLGALYLGWALLKQFVFQFGGIELGEPDFSLVIEEGREAAQHNPIKDCILWALDEADMESGRHYDGETIYVRPENLIAAMAEKFGFVLPGGPKAITSYLRTNYGAEQTVHSLRQDPDGTRLPGGGSGTIARMAWQGRHEAAHKVATAKHRALRPAASSS
jgi:hypothetical protein